MKTLILISLIFLASCAKEKNELKTVLQEQQQKQALQKPGRGHNSNQTTALLPLAFTQVGSSVQLDWELPTLQINEIIWWQWLNWEETDPSGKITLLQIMTDNGPEDIQGSEFHSIEVWYQQYVNSFLVTQTKPGYTYRFYVSGSYGPYYDVSKTVAYITNKTQYITVP